MLGKLQAPTVQRMKRSLSKAIPRTLSGRSSRTSAGGGRCADEAVALSPASSSSTSCTAAPPSDPESPVGGRATPSGTAEIPASPRLRLGEEPEDESSFDIDMGRDSMLTTEAAFGDRFDDQTDGEVWLHLYHTDAATAWLNWALLKYAEVPIYHAGVEVYGYEWSFQYFDDTWDDDTVSGVLCCQPKQMRGFDYQHSVCLGRTSLAESEVNVTIEALRAEWPACSYHITRHNCLSFAKQLVERLQVPEAFPAMLLGFSDAPSYMPKTDALVDFGWSWHKWAMQEEARKAALEEEDEDDSSAVLGQGLTGFPRGCLC